MSCTASVDQASHSRLKTGLKTSRACEKQDQFALLAKSQHSFFIHFYLNGLAHLPLHEWRRHLGKIGSTDFSPLVQVQSMATNVSQLSRHNKRFEFCVSAADTGTQADLSLLCSFLLIWASWSQLRQGMRLSSRLGCVALDGFCVPARARASVLMGV